MGPSVLLRDPEKQGQLASEKAEQTDRTADMVFPVASASVFPPAQARQWAIEAQRSHVMSTAPFLPCLRILALCGAILAGPATAGTPQRLPAVRDDIGQRALACLACHGQQPRGAQSGFFPRIAGKPSGYLYNQLINFRDGRRRYPLMNALVANLSDDYLREMADYFSTLQLPYPPPRPAGADLAQRGRKLVMQGDPARNIPACAACHGQALTGGQPAIPGLLGLSPDYLRAQFGSWKIGTRRAAQPDCMDKVSQSLSQGDIAAVTAWLASQAAPAGPLPPAPAGTTLPLPCGSVSQ